MLVAFLTTRVQSPTEDKAKLHRGMGCLIGTVNLSLTLKVEGPIRETAFVDASFATHSSDMKSHTGVSCNEQRYSLDFAKSRGIIGSIFGQQCPYQSSICEN